VAATVIATIGISASSFGAAVATDESAALLPFRWALVGCAMFAVAGSLIAALTVHDVDAAPSRGLAPAIRAAAERTTAPPADGQPSADGAVHRQS
jgi:hypothetical protein